ncbi:MAG: DUF1622 domain-containing protein [Mesorhizobium sp.]|nr:DUF1622 domain-containing protein [Mesorhizobium sp.]
MPLLAQIPSIDTFDRPFAMPFPVLENWLHGITGVIDILAVIVLLVGTGRFTFWLVRSELFSNTGDLRLERQNLARLELGRYILAALEVLIVADVIRTALTMQLQGLIFLAGLVVIRTAISWALDREIESLEKTRKHDAPR